LINARPPTNFSVGFFAVVDWVFSGAKRSGLERLPDGWFLG
jgi:hypothetical protein